MDITIKTNTAGVDWAAVSAILQSVGMAYYAPAIHEKAFVASLCAVFVYDGGKLIGFGRALSDGAYQAAIYDCAVAQPYQGKGIGKRIVREILDKVTGCNVILYAAPGKENFYGRLGFRKMKTGMACFIHGSAMAEKGFTE